MAKFIELHAHSDDDRFYINVSNIGFVEERDSDGAIVHICCTSFSKESGDMHRIYVKETYTKIKEKINE